jgi:hypothetical protein
MALGFLSISLVFYALQTQDIQFIKEDAATFFIHGLFAWIAGCIISLSFFVIKTGSRYFFLLAPIISVWLYGLKLLF